MSPLFSGDTKQERGTTKTREIKLRVREKKKAGEMSWPTALMSPRGNKSVQKEHLWASLPFVRKRKWTKSFPVFWGKWDTIVLLSSTLCLFPKQWPSGLHLSSLRTDSSRANRHLLPRTGCIDPSLLLRTREIKIKGPRQKGTVTLG